MQPQRQNQGAQSASNIRSKDAPQIKGPPNGVQSQTKNFFDNTTINRISGVLILIFAVLILWPYGWGSQIRYITNVTQPVNQLSVVIYSKLFIISAIFTVVGFGLIFFYYQNTATSIFTSLFVVSFTILVSPLIQKFWFNVFLSDFNGKEFAQDVSPMRFLLNSLSKKHAILDFYNLRISMANAISQLSCYLIVYGKLNCGQIVLNTIIYNVAWNFNHFLCIAILKESPDLRIFDDYQISNVYLFAGAYGIIFTACNPQALLARQQLKYVKKHNHIFALLGTFFIFLAFCCTTLLFTVKFQFSVSQFVRSYLWPEAFISIFFAMSASIISNIWVSVLLKGRIGLKEVLVGSISGAIMYGGIAGLNANLGATLTIGLISGIISALFYYKVEERINKNYIYDTLGGTIVLIVSFLGTFVVSPIIIQSYASRDWTISTFQVSALDTVGPLFRNKNSYQYMFIYVGFTLCVALATGIMMGTISRCLTYSSYKSFTDRQLFSSSYGLKSVNNQQQKAVQQ